MPGAQVVGTTARKNRIVGTGLPYGARQDPATHVGDRERPVQELAKEHGAEVDTRRYGSGTTADVGHRAPPASQDSSLRLTKASRTIVADVADRVQQERSVPDGAESRRSRNTQLPRRESDALHSELPFGGLLGNVRSARWESSLTIGSPCPSAHIPRPIRGAPNASGRRHDQAAVTPSAHRRS